MNLFIDQFLLKSFSEQTDDHSKPTKTPISSETSKTQISNYSVDTLNSLQNWFQIFSGTVSNVQTKEDSENVEYSAAANGKTQTENMKF